MHCVLIYCIHQPLRQDNLDDSGPIRLCRFKDNCQLQIVEQMQLAQISLCYNTTLAAI